MPQCRVAVYAVGRVSAAVAFFFGGGLSSWGTKRAISHRVWRVRVCGGRVCVRGLTRAVTAITVIQHSCSG